MKIEDEVFFLSFLFFFGNLGHFLIEQIKINFLDLSRIYVMNH